MKTLATGLAGLALMLLPGAAHAQTRAVGGGSVAGSNYAIDPTFEPSDENATFELRAGSYRPSLGAAFDASFSGDLGPWIGGELDLHAVRIPYIGPLSLGAAVGWSEWTGNAAILSGSAGANAGQTGLSLVDFAVLAVLRVDALSRHLDIPFVLSGKVGPDLGYWRTGTGTQLQGEGWSVGLRWAAQLALELDFLEPRAARRLDEAWGINHSALFFEVLGSSMGQWSTRQLPLGSDLAWTAGLGFTF